MPNLSPLLWYDATATLPKQVRSALDARSFWDHLHVLASLQGIVNRHGPRLFVRVEPEIDDFWWAYLRGENPRWAGGGWLAGRAVEQEHRLEGLIERFAGDLAGSVVYREQPCPGSNVASTLGGIEDRVCLRFDESEGSWYRRLGPRLASLPGGERRLFEADGTPIWRLPGAVNEPGAGDADCSSDKALATAWAADRWLSALPPEAVPHLAHYIDTWWLKDPSRDTPLNCTLANHDYFVARRGLFFDLSPWSDEVPVDEPDQPLGADRRSLGRLLARAHRHAGPDRIVEAAGFTPWAWKYSNHPGAGSRHHGVATEWELVKELSRYNAALDADALSLASMANASFYQHFPLLESYPQPARASVADRVAQAHRLGGAGASDRPEADDPVYVCLYMGDYDASAWLNRLVPTLWADAARGRVACQWPFNPNLCARAPQAMHFARLNAAPTDFFVAGNCGAGYLNPSMLDADQREPGVGDGWSAWLRRCEALYKRFDLRITGFIIEGHSPGLTADHLHGYAGFSPGGLVCHRHIDGDGVHFGPDGVAMPFARHCCDIGGDAGAAASAIVEQARSARETAEPGSPRDSICLMCRSVIQTPSWHEAVIARVAELDRAVRFVDVEVFFEIIRRKHATDRDRADRAGLGSAAQDG